MGTPLVILKSDASGFVVISMWYVPDAAGCGKARRTAGPPADHGDRRLGGADLKQAIKVADEPVSSPIVVGGRS